MKITVSILSIYFLLLFALPCCGFDNCPSDKTEQKADHNTGDKDGCGNCSPFFNCTGCSFVTIKAESISFTAAILQEPKIYAQFVPVYFPKVHYDFWQPPKLV